MERRVFFIILALLGIVGIAVLALQFRNTGRPLPTWSGQSEEMAALAERYRQLDARLARLEEILLGMTRAPTASLGSAKPATTDLGVVSEEKLQQQRVQLQARLQSLFEHEPRAADGAKWEAFIASAVADPNVAAAKQPMSRAIQCRANQCRITATFPPGSDANDWSSRMSMALAEGFTNSRVFVETLPSGETGLTIHAFKKGRDQALLEQGL